MDRELFIKQRQVANVAVLVWGAAQRIHGTLLFFGNEYLLQQADGGALTHYLYKLIDAVQRISEREVLVISKLFNVTQITAQTRADATAIADTLVALSANDDARDLFAFLYRSPLPAADPTNPFAEAEGWDLYDLKTQLVRMKVPTTEWRITEVNVNYALCATYPAHFAVPMGIDDFFLEAVAQFRSRRRIPALAYYYHQNKSCILRSGQPMVGVRRARCFEDEKLLLAVTRNAGKENHVSILDMRTKNNANAAMGRGGGVEPVERYGNCRMSYARLEHAYILREFLNKLLEGLCRQPDVTTAQFSQESAPWLGQVQVCLSAAVAIARAVAVNGTSVLVHCEDDSDTVPVVLSLAKLMLDPFYRTFKGIQILIEEDWLSFGFRFSDRCGHLKPESEVSKREQQIPYFVLFIDALLQITEQFPTAFEFNDALVHSLFEHAHSCQFGTFLFNSERERVTANLSKLTMSCWSHINHETIKPAFVNRFYRPCPSILRVSADSRSITIKAGLYNPWQRTSHLQVCVNHHGSDPLLDYYDSQLKELVTLVTAALDSEQLPSS